MKMKRKLGLMIPLTLLFMVVTTRCDMTIENENEPDQKRVLSNPDDIVGLASGMYNSWWSASHDYYSPVMAFATAADNVSCSWGNQGMREMSWEPRDYAWTNTASYGYRRVTKDFFDRMYSVIGTANDLIKIITIDGVDIDNGDGNDRVLAFCKFAQGIAYANLALVFDRAHIVDEVTTVEESFDAASDYKTVAAAAVGYLEDALTYSNSTFTIPSAWLGTSSDYSNTEFQKVIHSFIARTLAYMPRNSTDLAAVDWTKVMTHADAGITQDFSMVMDNYGNWYQEAGDYLTYSGWGVTDMYTVNLMDPTLPQHWDDIPNFPHPAESTNPIDERLKTDFEYIPSNWFRPERGYYHFSCYRHSRYDGEYVNGIGPMPEIMLSENDMLRAEARVYAAAPDLATAAAIINAGTRKTRGNMADVAAVKQDLIDAIHHERYVEMYITGLGLQFFEMRKRDLLQAGTPLHLPVPAEILQLFQLPQPYYTFGTTARADGIGTSNGGWR